jgi:hypothetical protein
VEVDDTFGWKLVFEVDLKLVELDDASPEYQKVAATYNVPGNYGISALVTEFKGETLHLHAASPARGWR